VRPPFAIPPPAKMSPALTNASPCDVDYDEALRGFADPGATDHSKAIALLAAAVHCHQDGAIATLTGLCADVAANRSAFTAGAERQHLQDVCTDFAHAPPLPEPIPPAPPELKFLDTGNTAITDCADAAARLARASTELAAGSDAAALADLEHAYRCKPSEDLLPRIVLAACRSSNAKVAMAYYAKAPNLSAPLVERCKDFHINLR
jgi:hypothetical protein